jgi:undecaprenyl diphosphate synthase
MDGNQRWSKKNICPRYIAYKAGAKKLISMSKFIFSKFDVPYVSAFAISRSNLNRSKQSINILVKILREFIDEYLNNLSKFNFNLIFIGKFDFLPKDISLKLEEVNKRSRNFKFNLIIFINYSGRYDVIESISSSIIKNKNITLNTFSNNLLTANLPDPDILIRTGGFKRISDFMLFQLSFTELFFLNCLWPDITRLQIKKIINKFFMIERKYGSN